MVPERLSSRSLVQCNCHSILFQNLPLLGLFPKIVCIQAHFSGSTWRYPHSTRPYLVPVSPCNQTKQRSGCLTAQKPNSWGRCWCQMKEVLFRCHTTWENGGLPSQSETQKDWRSCCLSHTDPNKQREGLNLYGSLIWMTGNLRRQWVHTLKNHLKFHFKMALFIRRTKCS